MQKTLCIDGKSYPVKSTARSMLEYRAQFGSDFFADLETLQRSADRVRNGSPNTKHDHFYSKLWLVRLSLCRRNAH